MSAYYNEIDPYCAAWLQNLMDAGEIPRGVIDTRSIEDVRPDELAGFTQCHFFAGIGGWAYALQLAGWGTRPVWTGSCPCQPFSTAGKGAGFADERHLWPAWQHLIAQCRPAVIFGEQVAAASDWLCLVFSDMEGMDYAMGCMPIEAASAGAEHYRDRYFFVADDDQQRTSSERSQRGGQFCGAGGAPENLARAMADRPSFGWGEGWTEHDFRSRGLPLPSSAWRVANTSSAPTENSPSGVGSLHPEFAGWELGYPPEWLSCAPSETRSIRARQRHSSSPTPKPEG